MSFDTVFRFRAPRDLRRAIDELARRRGVEASAYTRGLIEAEARRAGLLPAAQPQPTEAPASTDR